MHFYCIILKLISETVPVFQLPDNLFLTFMTIWLEKISRLPEIEARLVELEAMVSDAHFLCADEKIAHEYAKHGQNVYKYIFECLTNEVYAWNKCRHLAELIYLFGNPLQIVNNDRFSSNEIEMSIRLIKYWTNFAKTG